jgi:hypothetical protein
MLLVAEASEMNCEVLRGGLHKATRSARGGDCLLFAEKWRTDFITRLQNTPLTLSAH